MSTEYYLYNGDREVFEIGKSRRGFTELFSRGNDGILHLRTYCPRQAAEVVARVGVWDNPDMEFLKARCDELIPWFMEQPRAEMLSEDHFTVINECLYFSIETKAVSLPEHNIFLDRTWTVNIPVKIGGSVYGPIN